MHMQIQYVSLTITSRIDTDSLKFFPHVILQW